MSGKEPGREEDEMDESTAWLLMVTAAVQLVRELIEWWNKRH